MAIELKASADELMFDDDERHLKPPPAIPEEEKRIVKALLEGMILKHELNIGRMFEKALELLRHYQQKISAVLKAFIARHSMESKNAFK